ncbi:MAG: hypothetical protein IRY83_04115 [Chloroflexi bacterium]|nr:hypothetical protein [Chloroflexota bacterium]
MGHPPEWYLLIRAARYLGVAPWELARQSSVWRDWALISQSAEAEAEAEAMKRARSH